ncbi:acetylajmalan esterase [Manihot esculenta]|uniref:Acetylajmalan esterase-like n=1 Tax=Manihot esculenta TaxID=3983 RepID=A0A2C9UNK6_MANES|nr:acetylajmalan esterase [Manihot esculenta]
MDSCKLLYPFLLCCVFFFVLPLASDAHLLKACEFEAIYNLGDSISDTGNLILEDPASVFGRLPYGLNFYSNATGRCSNGLLMIVFIAKSAGIPLLNAYLNASSSKTHGVNFAVAGSTALPVEFLAENKVIAPVTNSSLAIQLNWMATHFNSTCHNSKDCIQKHKNSLFMVGEIGGNDYNYALFQGKTIDELKSRIPNVVNAIKDAVTRVIRYGATRVVVPGNFPIGCMHIYLTGFRTNDSNAYDELHCLKGLNNFSIYHNELLQQGIIELQEEHPHVTLAYGDYYNVYKWVLQKAAAGLLGFDPKSVQKACCGSGGDYDFSLERFCGAPDVPVCAKPEERMSWDGVHSTQKAYFFMARWLIRDIFQKLRCIA